MDLVGLAALAGRMEVGRLVAGTGGGHPASRQRRDGGFRGHAPGGPARDPGPARRGEWRGL